MVHRRFIAPATISAKGKSLEGLGTGMPPTPPLVCLVSILHAARDPYPVTRLSSRATKQVEKQGRVRNANEQQNHNASHV